MHEEGVISILNFCTKNMTPRLATFDDIALAPKIDLHIHLDGAVAKPALVRLADKHGIHLPPDILAHYPDAGPFNAHERPEEFGRFLSNFMLPLSIMKTPEGIYDTTLEVIHDLKAQNVIYAEFRLAPNYVASKEHSMETMVAKVLEAMEEGYLETGVRTKLILAIPREIDSVYMGDVTGNGITAEEIVELAMAYQAKGVVAIDLACAEQFGPEPYVDLFRKTVGSKLLRTVHAGEAGPQRARNVEIAIRDMGANGIGHGLTLTGQNGVLEEVKAGGIRIERCPLSNIAMQTTDGRLDGLNDLMRKGVLVSIGSDDHGVFGDETNLTHNLHHVAKQLALNPDSIRALTENAAHSAFLPKEEQEELLRKVTNFYE